MLEWMESPRRMNRTFGYDDTVNKNGGCRKKVEKLCATRKKSLRCNKNVLETRV